jgi:hypothetical protein
MQMLISNSAETAFDSTHTRVHINGPGQS